MNPSSDTLLQASSFRVAHVPDQELTAPELATDRTAVALATPPAPVSPTAAVPKRAATVAVVVPAYNAARFLEHTLQSIQAQTREPDEIIVVDDGSIDHTAAIVERLAATDRHLHLIRQPNRGVAYARNAGAARTSADYVAFCDADDWWDPEFLEKCLEVFQTGEPELGVVYAWTAHHFENGQPMGTASASRHEGYVARMIALENFLGNGSAALLRRELFEKAGGFNPGFADARAQGCEDWEFFARLGEITRFRVVPECLVHYRRSTQSMSSDHQAMARSHRLLLRLVFDQRPHLGAADRRFAESNFYFHLANESNRLAHPVECLRWLAAAVRADPFRILRRRMFYELVLRSAAHPLLRRLPTTTTLAAILVAAG